ncbi:uncharacterized protein LOC112581656 isoform X2 [Bubalus bubalis]|uniref:uncharacterized protein LOC112581656 isoform X2 n=1 Tax=Bubalus bubalis TaxID=89462 RepID=UPI001E1B9BC0|nr:uncharacterized protein LOC112581656 isoform X2 [Bubalus bubalis]
METRRYGTEAEGSRSLQGHVRTYGGPRAPNRAEGAWGRYCACARARVWAEGFRRSRRLRPALLGGRSHGRRWSVPDNGDKCAEAQSVLLREGRGRGEPLIARTKRLAFQVIQRCSSSPASRETQFYPNETPLHPHSVGKNEEVRKPPCSCLWLILPSGCLSAPGACGKAPALLCRLDSHVQSPHIPLWNLTNRDASG